MKLQASGPTNPKTLQSQTQKNLGKRLSIRRLDIIHVRLWALIKSGKLESTSVGRRRLIIYGSLEKLLLPEPPDPSPQPQRRGRPPKRPLAHKCERNAQDQGAPRRGMIDSAELGT
jgi:hypothetical protein